MSMEKIIKTIIDNYSKIESKIFTPTRFLLLNLLEYYQSGVQYRELQEALDISDGKLYSNLQILNELKLIDIEKIEIDNKLIDFITITDKGHEDLENTNNWIEQILKVIKKDV